MPSHSDVLNRWTDRVLGLTTKQALKGSNVFESGNMVYSYGHHFEMARLVTPRGQARFFLLNGDRYSVTTSGHQSDCRAAVARTGVASVIVPHSALGSAGVTDFDTLRILDTESERTEETTHKVTLPSGMRAAMMTEARSLANSRLAKLKRLLEESGDTYDHRHGAISATAERVHAGMRISFTCTVACHEYGHPAGWQILETPREAWYRDGHGFSYLGHGLSGTQKDTFTYSTYRHFLGGSLFTAKVNERKVTELARCDQSDRAKCAELDAMYPDAWKRVISDTLPSNPGILGSVAVWNDERIVTRRARFLSAFDMNEARPLYFLCELPATSRAVTIAVAYDDLAPELVHEARAAGLDVLRQGDVFAIPMVAPYVGPPAIAAKYAAKRLHVLGTNHTASEVVTVTDGRDTRTYARGVLRHEPGFHRTADHARVSLGKTWHLLVKNTVPVSKLAAMNSRQGSRQSGQARAWTLAGNVD